MTTTTRSKTARIGVAAVIVATIFMAVAITGADAQSPTAAPALSPMAEAPAPALDCITALSNVTDCLTFVEAGSNLTKPDTGCCGELAGLVESQPICLCQLLGNPGSTGFDIDLNKALKLPNVCGVSTPPPSLCSAFGVPVAVPTASEGPGPSSAITGADVQSPTAAPALSPMAEAPAPALDCITALSNVTDCLTFVEAGSNLTKPDTGCCGELAGLVESQPICLCQLLGNPGATGLDIDLNKALKLPNVCGVSTPPPSLCSAFGVPVAVPTASEGPGPSSGSGSAPGSTPGSDNNGTGVSSSAVFDITIFMGLGIAFITLFL